MNNPYEDMTAELEAQQQEHLKETALLLPANSFESLTEPPASPTETETATENSNEPPSLSDFHQTTLVWLSLTICVKLSFYSIVKVKERERETILWRFIK